MDPPPPQPSSVSCTFPDGRQEVFPCSPPTLSPALGPPPPPTLAAENDDPFWDKRLCVVCARWMHPRDNHRVCFLCGRCSPLDSCNICALWDLKRWKEVGQWVEKRKESSPPSQPPPPLKKPKLPSATVTSVSVAPPPPAPQPQPSAVPFPATPCSTLDKPLTHAPTRGEEGQYGMREHESGRDWQNEECAWEDYMSEEEAESEADKSDLDATISGERALTRAMVESAWSVIRETLPPHNFHVAQGPSKSRVRASFFERKDVQTTLPMAYCSAKVPQYREAFNSELQHDRFALSGYPEVSAVYPSAIAFIKNTPLPLQAEKINVPRLAVGYLGTSKPMSCPAREWNKLTSFWNDQVSVASFQELCALALNEILAKASSDTQALPKAKTLSDALLASSSLSLMGSLRGSTYSSMLSRDTLLRGSKLPSDLSVELRQAELGSDSPFGPKLAPVVAKAQALHQSSSRTRPSFRAPRRTPSFAFPTTQSPAFGRPSRGRGSQQGRSHTSRRATLKQPSK